ncbi:MAG: hypothetical protein GY866_01155 [Proteobacteria bacterium]|nr:hypothetical protein [Pseudomonadota bacterium]
MLYNNLDKHGGIQVSWESEQTPGDIAYQTATDNSGAYEFNGVEQGSYLLHAASRDSTKKTITRSITVTRKSQVVVDIVLTAAENITGRVTLEEQTDHLGALVFLEGTSYNAYTDSNGDFRIDNIPVAEYVLNAVRDGHNPSTGTVVSVTTETTDIPAIGLTATTATVNYSSLIVVTDESAGDNCANNYGQLGLGHTTQRGDEAYEMVDRLLPLEF